MRDSTFNEEEWNMEFTQKELFLLFVALSHEKEKHEEVLELLKKRNSYKETINEQEKNVKALDKLIDYFEDMQD